MSRTLPELETAMASNRAAKSDTESEIAELQDRRKRVLLSGDIDVIEEIDQQIRRHNIEVEIADAKARELHGFIYLAREEAKRWAGVNMPTDDQLAKLFEIVSAAHPGEFRDSPKQFRSAFYAVGRLGRLSEPSSDRYFVSSLDDANEITREARLESVDGDLFLAACLAWGDISWRAHDKATGGQLEIALAKRFQGTPAKPVWRHIFTGDARLVAPLQPRNMRASSSTYPEPRVRIRYGDGREVDPAAPLGVQ
jgi:hypothetical protein